MTQQFKEIKTVCIGLTLPKHTLSFQASEFLSFKQNPNDALCSGLHGNGHLFKFKASL
jgi:hypothetical protein